MAKVSRAYIKGTGADQSGSIQAGATIYAQDILDLIDSAKWYNEGIDSVYYDYENHGIKVVKSSDPDNPVFISVPRNSDIVNKLVKGVDKYELHSDSGLVAKTDLPSTLVTSVACDKAANELQVSSTSSDSGITVPLPDSLKSVAIEGNTLTFTSLDGTPTTIDLPDSLKSVTIEGNELTFTSLDGVPSTISLPITTGYLSDVSLADGTLTFTKEGASDVNVALPFISKAITGVSLQGSNLVFTFSDDTVANITLPTQSEGGTTAGLLSGVRIDGNQLIFTVSGGDDITITLPSTSGGSGDVDLTGLLFNPTYELGRLSFDTKNGSIKTVNLDGISVIRGLSGDNLEYGDIQGNLHQVSLSNLTKGVLTGASLNGGNLVFTAKDSDNVSVPLNSLTSGVLTGVSLSNGNLVFTTKDSDNISIPISSGSNGVKSVQVTDTHVLKVTDSNDTIADFDIMPYYRDTKLNDFDMHFGWGGSLGYSTSGGSAPAKPYTPLWVPTGINYIDSVIKSSVPLNDKTAISLDSSTPTYVESGYVHGSYYNPPSGYSSDAMDFIHCSLPFDSSFSESSGTFTANVITNVSHNWDFVLMSNYLNLTLNGNVLEAFPSGDSTSVLHLLQRSSSLTRFHGFAFPVGDFVILIDKYMFFANQVFDWSFNATNSFGMRFYLSNSFDMYTGTLRFTATAGKVLE